jgi:2-aminoethylphosphonate-pyruvate transaminase
MGLRLEDLGRQLPKGFLRLAALPIVEESILRLRQAGIRRIVIVTGHLAEFYRDLQAAYPNLVETVHNPRFADSGSMASLYEARHRLGEDFLLLESDLIYEPRALGECLEFPQDNAVLLSGPTGSGDEVFVAAQGGRLLNMSKDRRRVEPDVCGELVGISKISTALYRTMLTAAERMFADAGHLRFHYETDVLVAAAAHTPVYCHLVPDLIWAEIDDPNHLRRAESLVYPAIAAKDPLRSSSLSSRIPG